MMRLDYEAMEQALLPNLVRLAQKLQCCPTRTMGESDASYKGRVIFKIMRAEKKLDHGMQEPEKYPKHGGGWA